MKRVFVLSILFLVASVGGFSVGVSTPPKAQAQSPIGLDVFPGDQSNDWAYMTCGWHDVCQWPYNGSSSLDWGNQAGYRVVWRSRANRPGVTWVVATAYPVWYPTSCKNVDADAYDVNGVFRGWVRYTHSESPTASFYVLANSSWYYQANYVATTAATDLGGCPASGPHLHQNAAYYWTRNAGAFPNAPTAEWRYVWDHPMNWTGW